MSYYYTEPEYTVLLEHGFQTKTRNMKHLEKHGLIGKDLLSFVNELCILVDEKRGELPEDEWYTLEFTLRALMVKYDGGELYYFFLHTYDREEIKYNTWVHFASDSTWGICVRTFKDMPTDVLEQFALKAWKHQSRNMGYEGKENIMKAISERTDIYGDGSLPIELVKGILFDIV